MQDKVDNVEKSIKPVQFANTQRLVHLDDVTPIIDFLEQFRTLVEVSKNQHDKMMELNIKIPAHILESFKQRVILDGNSLSHQLVDLITDWLSRDCPKQ